jgi:hypothetical protein
MVKAVTASEMSAWIDAQNWKLISSEKLFNFFNEQSATRMQRG